ncbi:MAG: hypothetical protein ACP5O8_01775, partial [Candidatus Aenigmatarchaeota archaeon]
TNLGYSSWRVVKGKEIKEAGFKGKIVFLDSGCKIYQAYQNKVKVFCESLLNEIMEYIPSLKNPELLLTNPEHFQKELLACRDKIIYLMRKASKGSHEIEDLYEDKLNLNIEREKHWTKQILKNFEEPSVINCGAAHLSDGIEVLKLLPYFPIRVPGLLYYRKKGKIGILRKLLEYEGIKLEVRDVIAPPPIEEFKEVIGALHLLSSYL